MNACYRYLNYFLSPPSSPPPSPSDTSCYQCAGFNDHDPLRRLVTECTRFHDTVVRCVKGFFYVYDPIGGDCLKCTNCTLLRGKYYEIQACSDTEDTICCDKENMMVKDGTCVEPLVCGPGQFLVPAQADREEECRQCELGSSNPEVHHRKRSCDQRQRDSDDEGGENESSDKETGDFRVKISKMKDQTNSSPTYFYLLPLFFFVLLLCFVFIFPKFTRWIKLKRYRYITS